MTILKNVSLKDKNTLRLEVKSAYYAEANSESELIQLLEHEVFRNNQKLILGSGANVLFTKDFEGLIIKFIARGMNVIEEDSSSVMVEVNAGESWHNFVNYAVDNSLGGIENLALIPGSAGAAPVQNIAAYGQNFIDSFYSLEALNIQNGKSRKFLKEDCMFSYRESIFKHEFKDLYLITKIRMRLRKNPEVNTSYFETGTTYVKGASILLELAQISKPPYSIKDMYNAVINIRTKKLPNPSEIGTAGSFFKNPLITWERYLELKDEDPDLQWYPSENLEYTYNEEKFETTDLVKIPAARLIDNLGWKGKRKGGAGVYPFQALNIVNYGNAKPEDIMRLFITIREDVEQKYGIKLEPEVRII